MSLFCLIRIGNRPTENALNENVSEFVKLIVKPDFPCVEVTDTKLFTDGFKVNIGSDVRIFIWKKVDEDWTPCCLAQTQRKTSV